jgi:hypothetical protein
MSEVDRLSSSGLYPALPIADQGRSGGQSRQGRDPRERAAPGATNGEPKPAADGDKPAKSLIDEYA